MGGVRLLCVRLCLKKRFYCSQGGCHLNLGNWTAPGSPGPLDFQAVLGCSEDRAQRLCPAFPCLAETLHHPVLSSSPSTHGPAYQGGSQPWVSAASPCAPSMALWASGRWPQPPQRLSSPPPPEAKRELQGPCAPQTTIVINIIIFNSSNLSCTDSSFPQEYSFPRDPYGSLPSSSRPLTKRCLLLRPSRPPSPIILTLLGHSSFCLSPPDVLCEYLYRLSPPPEREL